DEIIEAIIVDEHTTEHGNSLVESSKSRVLTLCALYVAQGIPWGFMTVTFVTYLALEGVGAGKLALLLTLGTLPWSIKFLWGPVIDRFQYREMGRRRPWILAAQTGMVIFLSAILFVPDPASNVLLVSIMFCVYNIFTSLQDVATDALAVDILRHDEIEQVNSYMFTSKSVGGIIGGAGLGSVINILGIKGAIALQIPILIVIMLVPIYMTERPGEKRFPWSDSGEIVDYESKEQPSFGIIFANIKTALNIKAAQLGVLLSLTVSLSFFLIPVLPLLFVRELGWTEEQFNQTKGGVILIVTMLGYLVGGVLGKTIGGKATIIYAAVGTAITTTIWGLTEGLWGEGIFMMAIWSLRTFGWAVVMVNIYSLMMKVTWGEVGGTQFTGYMAMMNLSAIIGYQLAEPFASRFDYPTLFIMAAVFETLVVLAVMFIDPDQTRRELSSIS
ncbi:MAG TPA: MFS transporter, partial [Candidatus Poseidoniaceae archaeon]